MYLRPRFGLSAESFESRRTYARFSPNEKKPLAGLLFLAERVGFEPTVRSHVRLISSQVHSTTLPPLLIWSFCRMGCSKAKNYSRTLLDSKNFDENAGMRP